MEKNKSPETNHPSLSGLWVCNGEKVEIVYWKNGERKTVEGQVRDIAYGDKISLSVRKNGKEEVQEIHFISECEAIEKITTKRKLPGMDGEVLDNPLAREQSKQKLDTDMKIDAAYLKAYGPEGVKARHNSLLGEAKKGRQNPDVSSDITPVLKAMEFVKSLHHPQHGEKQESTEPSKYKVEDLPHNVKDFIKEFGQIALFKQNGTRPHGDFERRIISCEYNNELGDARDEAYHELRTFKNESFMAHEHTSFDDVSDTLRSGRKIMRDLLNSNYPPDLLKTAMTEAANVAFQKALDALGSMGYDVKSPKAQDVAFDVVAVVGLKTECLLAAASYLVFDGQPELAKFADLCMTILKTGGCLLYNNKYEIFMYAETPKRPANK